MAIELFEDAISATGYGRFNVFLMMLSIPGTAAIYFASTSMSFIIASAECDLGLTLPDKGRLNAVTYLGMVLSVVPWSLLADIKGPRYVMINAYMMDALLVLCCALSQTKYELVILKFLEGCCISGAYGALMMYISEMHGRKHRSLAILFSGTMVTCAAIYMPLLAAFMLPYRSEYTLGPFYFRSWQFFLATAALPSLICGFGFLCMPESAKFLMTMGQHEKALQVLGRIFAMNTRRPVEEYPVHNVQLNLDPKPSLQFLIARGCERLKPMFDTQMKCRTLCICGVSFCMFMCQNTLRLWMPQLFVTYEEYALTNIGASSLCTIFEHTLNRTDPAMANSCYVIITTKSLMLIVMLGVTSFAGFLLAFALINCAGAKRVLGFGLFTSTALGCLLYGAIYKQYFLVIVALYLAMASLSITAALNVAILLFPAHVRNTVVALTMMCGHVGSVFGNLAFPYLIQAGCVAPILGIGGTGLVACVLSHWVPKPKRVAFAK